MQRFNDSKASTRSRQPATRFRLPVGLAGGHRGRKPLKTPLPGAEGQIPIAPTQASDVPRTEDDQSIGSVITFGRFSNGSPGRSALNRQFESDCPNNRLGTVDLLIAARHGNVNAELLAHALRPRVAITNNGTRKGGQPEAMKIFTVPPGGGRLADALLAPQRQEYAVPGVYRQRVGTQQRLPCRWRLLRSAAGARSASGAQHDGPAYYFKVLAQRTARSR